MWFGTDAGLVKWDGNQLKTYIDNNYSSSYSYIQEDKEGRIWCQNFTGQIFYVENDSFYLFKNEEKSVVAMLSYTIAYFPEIYLSTDFGIIKHNFLTKEKVRITIKAHKTNSIKPILDGKDTVFYDPIVKIRPLKDGLMFMSSGDLYQLNLKSEQPKFLIHYPKRKMMVAPNYQELNNQVLYVASQLSDNQVAKSVVSYYSNGNFKDYNLNIISDLNPDAYYYDKDKHLFLFGGKNGLFLTDSLFQLVYEPFLAGKNISDVIKDEEGNYWVSTLNEGIFILSSIDVSTFKDIPKIASFVKDKKDQLYFISANGEVYRYRDTGNLSLLGSFDQRVEYISYNPFLNSITAGNIKFAFNLSNNTIYNYPFGYNIKSATYFSDNILIGSGSTGAQIKFLKLQDQYSDKVKSLLNKENPFHYDTNLELFFNMLRGKRSKQNIYDLKNEVLYVSYSDGLYYYKNNREVEIKLDGESILTSFMQPAKNGGILCSAMDGKVYKVEQGLVTELYSLNLSVSKIIEWNKYLFLATNKGVVKYNLTTKQSVLINQLDGLISNQILDIEIKDNVLFVATNKGVSKMPCTYGSINTKKPSVTIDRVLIWEKDTVLKPSYNLSHQQNNFTFYYRAIATRSQQTYQFKYRLLGLDSNWITQKSENNLVRFPSLPPGDFTFEVKAVNEDGIESEYPAQIKLFIDKPFYQKWWFYLCIIVFIIVSMSVIFLIRIQIIRKRNKVEIEKEGVEKELSRSQLTSLRSQMNPHFMFNALNSIQEFIMTNKKELAGDYLGDFADLMRLYLTHSQKEMLTVREELKAIKLYLHLEKVRFENTLTYSIDVASDLDKDELKLPSMLIQPFLENAIKHGLLHKKVDRNLEVKFSIQDQFLICTVKDNGVGRSESARINKMRGKKYISYATSAIEKRVDLLNKDRINKIVVDTVDLYTVDKKSQGTLVEIKVPTSL